MIRENSRLSLISLPIQTLTNIVLVVQSSERLKREHRRQDCFRARQITGSRAALQDVDLRFDILVARYVNL
jgi:hypothetical protein